MTRLPGHTSIVTGGAAGVGRGLVLALAEAGAYVAVLSRSPENGARIEQELNAAGGQGAWLQCDVTDADQVARAVTQVIDERGGLNSVFHNATADLSSQPTDLLRATKDEFQAHAQVALGALVHLTQTCFTPLEASNGRLVVLTSTTAFQGNAKLPFYATVKGAQVGFVRCLAREWGGAGITVNALVPLATSPATRRADQKMPGLAAENRRRTAVAFMGEPQRDIGPAAVFLASPDSRYITGHTLMVNGGAFMQ